MVFKEHGSRLITAPDGSVYFITNVTDTNTIVIDRPYAGSTVTGVSGAATIHADEDYAEAQAIDDTGWTIKKSDWNADGDDLFSLNGNGSNYYINFVNEYHSDIKNIYIYGSSDLLFYGRNNYYGKLRNCIFYHTGQDEAVQFVSSGTFDIDQIVISGDGLGSNQVGIAFDSGSNIFLSNAAVYGMSLYGIRFSFHNYAFLENVNIGVEVANGSYDMYVQNVMKVQGRDVKFGDANPFYRGGYFIRNTIAIENYNKVLGDHRVFTTPGEHYKINADGSGNTPNQRAGGNSDLIGIEHDVDVDYARELKSEIFEHEFEVDTSSKTYRYYVQSMAALTASELWIEAEYVDSYDSTTKYTFAKVNSDETISARSDQSDWTQYIEVTGIQPAVASKVRIRCFCSYFHATNKIYIDPKVAIS
jgi:hypothetical protein